MTEIVVVKPEKACLFCGTEISRERDDYAKAKYCGHPCHKAAIRASGPERFWAKVDKGPHPKGCWLYTGFIKWDGYGWVARSQGHKRYRWMTAHRYVWILTHGVPPEGMSIMHLCDVPACCNPDHLKLGTHDDNMADCKAKGRNNSGYIKKYRPVLYPDRVRPKKVA